MKVSVDINGESSARYIPLSAEDCRAKVHQSSPTCYGPGNQAVASNTYGPFSWHQTGNMPKFVPVVLGPLAPNNVVLRSSQPRRRATEAERCFHQFVMAIRLSLSPAIMATYHSAKHEDPERYLQRPELQMWDYRMGPDQWADYAVKQLRGEAAAWAEKYTGLQIDGPEFCECFRHHFTGPYRNAEL